MSAEIICVGTELLLGDILNGNARHLARQLADLGIPHYYQTVVGDNPARIQAAIAIAIERGAKILIFTGGLGPTPDDLTIAAIADYFKTPLSERAEIIADIEAKYRQRGRVMNPSNRKQALIPDGADVLPNPVGTAPGIIWRAADDVTILTFPGVPAEMRAMWTETAIPYLQEQGWGDRVLTSEMLKFWGISESVLAERVGDLFDSENPTVAPYADGGGRAIAARDGLGARHHRCGGAGRRHAGQAGRAGVRGAGIAGRHGDRARAAPGRHARSRVGATSQRQQRSRFAAAGAAGVGATSRTHPRPSPPPDRLPDLQCC